MRLAILIHLLALFLAFGLPHAHGGVTDGTPVNAATTNAAFMDKNANTFTSGTVDVRGGTITTGLLNTTLGIFKLFGNTSGTITVQPQATAGTYNLNLPIIAGTSGSTLHSGGGGSTAMTWEVPTYYNGYYPPSGSNYWSTTSSSYADMAVNGSIPTISIFQSSNLTVANATSNLAGINFQAPYTGVIKITAIASTVPGTTGTPNWSMQLIETTTVTTIDQVGGYIAAASNTSQVVILEGYFAVTASTTYNFKIQGKISTSTLFIANNAASGPNLSFKVDYLK